MAALAILIALSGCDATAQPGTGTSSSQPLPSSQVSSSPPLALLEIKSGCPEVELPPSADSPAGLVMHLSLASTQVRQGNAVGGQLTIENHSARSIDFYWEEQLPSGLLRGGTLVGGVRQAGGGVAGYTKRTIGPGQTVVFPYAVNTLGCPVPPAPRTPLPPGRYTAMALVYDGSGRFGWYATADVSISA